MAFESTVTAKTLLGKRAITSKVSTFSAHLFKERQSEYCLAYLDVFDLALPAPDCEGLLRPFLVLKPSDGGEPGTGVLLFLRKEGGGGWEEEWQGLIANNIT